mmetsp:Transcript_4522/g.17109  ORF Transcript_4522/g.17109 Transcript_4522/m.17109 type:complete len:224 (+) Transcript_4522:3514-4185(+)
MRSLLYVCSGCHHRPRRACRDPARNYQNPFCSSCLLFCLFYPFWMVWLWRYVPRTGHHRPVQVACAPVPIHRALEGNHLVQSFPSCLLSCWLPFCSSYQPSLSGEPLQTHHHPIEDSRHPDQAHPTLATSRRHCSFCSFCQPSCLLFCLIPFWLFVESGVIRLGPPLQVAPPVAAYPPIHQNQEACHLRMYSCSFCGPLWWNIMFLYGMMLVMARWWWICLVK